MAKDNYEIENFIGISDEKDKILFEQFKKMQDTQKLLLPVTILLWLNISFVVFSYNMNVNIITSTLCVIAIIYMFFKRRKERQVIKKAILPDIRKRSNASATLKDIRILKEDEDKIQYGFLLVWTIGFFAITTFMYI